jgi:predicted nuclease of predicted toxin-antitoxin system
VGPVKLKVDENLPMEVAVLLREAGHDALTVKEQALTGVLDAPLLAVCTQEARALVTLDVGFANTLTYPPGRTAGLIVLRLERQDKAHVLAVVRTLLPVLAQEPVAGRLWIVDERRVRIREG